MKIIKNIIKGILFSPINALFIIIAVVHLIISSLFKRYKKIKNDLVSFIPTKIHQFKMWKKYRKR